MDFAGRKIFTQDVTVSGNGNVVINGNRVIVNGKLVKDFNDVNEKTIYVIVNGDVGNLEVGCCEKVEVKGTVKSVKTQSGDVHVTGNVEGGLTSTSGDVECGDVGGDVTTTSGDVKCKNISGNVKTVSGDIGKRWRL